MAVKFSTAVRNIMLDSIESTVGPSPRLVFYTGSAPSNTVDVPTGTVISTMVLPTDWMLPASNGQKLLSGTWTTTASAAGVAGYYRIWDSTGSVCHEQGSITMTGGGGDITVDNTNIALGQTITMLTKTLSTG